MSRKQRKSDEQRALECIIDHQCKPRSSRAFDFRTPSKGSHYAYSLTWTPGSLALAGDLGELTLVHYHALRDPITAALDWAATSDLDYLFEKTERKRSYDREATLKHIVHWANEPAVEALKGWRREELQTWRDERPYTELAAEMDAWTEARPKLEVTKQSRYLGKGILGDRNEETLEAPDGWENWLKLWHALKRKVFIDDGDPGMIFTREGRRAIIEELEGELEYEHEANSFQYNTLGMDAESLSVYSWTYHDIAQMTAIKHGAKLARQMVLGELVAEKSNEVMLAVLGKHPDGAKTNEEIAEMARAALKLKGVV